MTSPYTSTTSWQRWTNTLASRKWNARYHPLNHTPRFTFRRRSYLVIIVAALGTTFLLMQAWNYTTRQISYGEADRWIVKVFPDTPPFLEDEWSRWKPEFMGNTPLEELQRNQAENQIYSCANTPLPHSILRGFYFENVEDSDVKPDRRRREAMRLFPKYPTLLLASGSSTTVNLKAGQPYCIRVVLPPPLHLQPTEDQGYVPYAGTFWDSIMMNIVSQTAQLTLPVQLKQWSGHSKIFSEINYNTEVEKISPHDILPRDKLHIYESEIKIVDIGTYDLVTRLEYTNGRWNFEVAPIIPYNPLFINPPNRFKIVVDPVLEPTERQDHLSSGLSAIAEQTYLNHFSLPLCTRPDHPGRWLNIEDFPESQRALAAAVDWQGNFWAPFKCRHQKYKYAEFNRCLSRKYPIIHWFGDSNSRRALKKIITQGAWCTNITEIQEDETKRRNCHCEDYREESWKVEVFNPYLRANKVLLANSPEEDRRLDKEGTPWNFEAGRIAENGGAKRNDAEIWFYKWDGLTNLNDPAWYECFKEYPSVQDLLRYIPDLKTDEEWIRRYDANVDVVDEANPFGLPKKAEVKDSEPVVTSEHDDLASDVADNEDSADISIDNEEKETNETQKQAWKRNLPSIEDANDDELSAIKSRMKHLIDYTLAKYINHSSHASPNASSYMLPHSHPEPLAPSHFYSATNSSFHKRWYLTLAPPQLVIISLGNWDTAWMPMADYIVAVAKLTAYLLQRYVPYKTPIVYRPPQYYCCRTDDSEWQRRLSTKRVEAYDAVAREMLTTKVGAKVWDVYALGEGRSWENKHLSVDCASNHMGSDVVEVENQILMNGLCNSNWFDDDMYKSM